MLKRLSLILVAFSVCACQDFGNLTLVANFPDHLQEVSGIESLGDDGTIWAIEDSGNKDHIYQIDTTGNVLRDINIKNAKNKDWEDLAKDENGNLYIGDFGNNNNRRKDLVIYKVSNPNSVAEKSLRAEKIRFYFPEQISFPPNPRELLYDVESFFYLNGYLYLFTRNRMPKKLFDGRSLIYRIPAVEGDHKAEMINQFVTCDEAINCQISAAAISPDKSKVALLSYDKVWILSDFEGADFLNGNIEEIDLGHATQKEGICFLNNDTLLISDEKGKKKTGSKLYSYSLKAKP